jgi:hypothetical protein
VNHCYVPSRAEQALLLDDKERASHKTKLKAKKMQYRDHLTGKTWNITVWACLRATKSLFDDFNYKSAARVL